MFKKILPFIFFVSQFIYSQDNIPPEIFSEGNEVYCPLTEQNIVTSFNIIDPDDTTVTALYIQISEGYVQAEDLLILTGENQGIQETWDAITGKLELKGQAGGEVLYTDLIAAVYDVKFSSSNPAPANDKSFSFTIGDANYLDETEHYYVYFENENVLWTEAKELAENSTYFGLQGYLATITSEVENQIAAVQVNDFGWIGGSDQENENDWRWVTGPEGLENGGSGVAFWSGNGSGSGGFAVNGMYSNWNGTNEPNQSGDEDYLHVTSPNVGNVGSWNDLLNDTPNSGDYQAKGYTVEYGGMPGDPILNLSSSSSLYMPNLSLTPFVGCLNELSTNSLSAVSNIESGEVYWFDSQVGGNLVFTGTNFNPDISETTTYYVSPFEEGICDNFERIEIQAVIFPSPVPVAPDVMVDQCTYTSNDLVRSHRSFVEKKKLVLLIR